MHGAMAQLVGTARSYNEKDRQLNTLRGDSIFFHSPGVKEE